MNDDNAALNAPINASAKDKLQKGKVARLAIARLGLLEGALTRIDYRDTYGRVFSIDKDASLHSVLGVLFQSPDWVLFLLRLRDCIVRPFGLKTADEIEGETQDKSLDAPFHILAESPDGCEMLMGEDDKHLNFRVIIRREPFSTDAENTSSLITISTAVTLHNGFGRLYFFIIKPFHRLIVASLLRSRPFHLNGKKD
jgi:hypothetical protein